ncbi:MAG TPA: tetratricopeptide repeat protein [Kofleriaceae bacterium]|nr:tetratricopeptide repeat protein [Kofleriaceae bacterium]
MSRFAAIVLALCVAGAGACGGKDKGKTTTPTGGGKGSGGGSDASGMNDGDPTNDGEGGPGGDGTGAGTGTPTADGMFTSDPGPDGVVGTADDVKGTGGGAGPSIVPPNLDISPEQARTQVEQHLRVARGMLGATTPDPDGAIREARAALAVDGTSIDAIVVIAHANYHKRLYDTAEVILDGLLEKRATSRDNEYLYYVYGLVYDKLNEPQKAFAAYKKAVSLSPSFASALVNLGVHQLTNKQYRDAVETYEKLTGQLGKNDAATWNSLGSAYRGISGDFDAGAGGKDEWVAKAENAFKRAQTADKNYGPAYYNLGLLYLDADPFPTTSGPMDTLARLNRAKTYFDEYKNMPGVNMALYDERIKDVTKLIKREEKKRAKAARP